MDNEVKKYVSLYKIVLDLSFNIYCSLINACIFSLKKGSPDMRDIVMLAINAILFYRRDLVQKLSHSYRKQMRYAARHMFSIIKCFKNSIQNMSQKIDNWIRWDLIIQISYDIKNNLN